MRLAIISGVIRSPRDFWYLEAGVENAINVHDLVLEAPAISGILRRR